jgi:hypothetical protein
MSGPDRVWLITKQGAYYRPNSRGYTTCFYAAGRYTLEEAEKFTHPNGAEGPRDGMGYVRQDHVKRDPIDPAVIAALPEVAALVAEAVAQERERCAKVADASPDSHWGPTIAAAIRAGGKP